MVDGLYLTQDPMYLLLNFSSKAERGLVRYTGEWWDSLVQVEIFHAPLDTTDLIRLDTPMEYLL